MRFSIQLNRVAAQNAILLNVDVYLHLDSTSRPVTEEQWRGNVESFIADGLLISKGWLSSCEKIKGKSGPETDRNAGLIGRQEVGRMAFYRQGCHSPQSIER
jgi:hypothetical protein